MDFKIKRYDHTIDKNYKSKMKIDFISDSKQYYAELTREYKADEYKVEMIACKETGDDIIITKETIKKLIDAANKEENDFFKKSYYIVSKQESKIYKDNGKYSVECLYTMDDICIAKNTIEKNIVIKRLIFYDGCHESEKKLKLPHLKDRAFTSVKELKKQIKKCLKEHIRSL